MMREELHINKIGTREEIYKGLAKETREEQYCI
jgi:hypothetical protein